MKRPKPVDKNTHSVSPTVICAIPICKNTMILSISSAAQLQGIS
ncbi:hypothetical protein [Sulfurimonas sp. HSL-1716]